MTWPLVKLDAVAIRGSGHTPSQKHPEYWNGGVKWVSLADSSTLDKRYIYDTEKKISALGLRNSSAVLHPKGTVIVSRDAGVGKSSILGEEMAVSQHFIVWQCDENKIHGEYLYQWLQSHKPEFERMAVGSTVKTIGLGYFEKLRIPLPPIETQTKVAAVLADWDTAIEKTEQLIAAKEKQYLALVGHLVLQPASKYSDWRHERIRDFATRIQRKAGEGEYPILTISSASGFVLQEVKYGRYMAGESVKDYILLRRGEFAYNKGNSLRYQFGCVYQLTDYEEALVPHVYVCFNLHENISDSYLRHLFAVDYLKPQLGKLVKTGVRNNGLLNIRPDEFLDVTVPIPPLDEQMRIAAALDAASAEIAVLKQQVSAYRTQKRGLMQKLLTGQWRIGKPPSPPAPLPQAGEGSVGAHPATLVPEAGQRQEHGDTSSPLPLAGEVGRRPGEGT